MAFPVASANQSVLSAFSKPTKKYSQMTQDHTPELEARIKQRREAEDLKFWRSHLTPVPFSSKKSSIFTFNDNQEIFPIPVPNPRKAPNESFAAPFKQPFSKKRAKPTFEDFGGLSTPVKPQNIKRIKKQCFDTWPKKNTPLFQPEMENELHKVNVLIRQQSSTIDQLKKAIEASRINSEQTVSMDRLLTHEDNLENYKAKVHHQLSQLAAQL